MLIKRLALFLAAMLLCGLLPTVLAEGADFTVTLNDGGDIPYLADYQSRFIKDADSIRGITGRIDFTWTYQQAEPQRQIDMTLQNIALTDDVLVLFFTQTTADPTVYDGQTHAGYGWGVKPSMSLRLGDAPATLDLIYREGHPLDDRTEACMAAYSLAAPLSADAVLTLRQGDVTAAIRFDRTRADDPTVAATPMEEVSLTLSPWEEEAPVDYHFIIERVAVTPFGGRVLLNYRTINDVDAFMSYQVLNDQGAVLPTYTSTLRSSGLASPEHPQWVRNEAWFLGGEGSTAFTLVPLGTSPTSLSAETTISLDALPADVTLACGKTLHIERCNVLADGFEVAYCPVDHIGDITFDLADASGRSLDLNYVISTQYAADHVRGLLGFDALWSQEHKGRTVAMVTPEEIAQIKQLIIRCGSRAVALLTEQGVRVEMGTGQEGILPS